MGGGDFCPTESEEGAEEAYASSDGAKQEAVCSISLTDGTGDIGVRYMGCHSGGRNV